MARPNRAWPQGQRRPARRLRLGPSTKADRYGTVTATLVLEHIKEHALAASYTALPPPRAPRQHVLPSMRTLSSKLLATARKAIPAGDGLALTRA